jgi:thiamine kinase
MSSSRVNEFALRHVPGTGAVQIAEIHGGLVNDSFRVERDGRAYVLRVSARDSAELGIDRRWECRVRRAAGEGGLAPALICCMPEDRLMVTAWAAGRVWSRDDAREPRNLTRIATPLAQVHQLTPPHPARRMSPRDWCDRYGSALHLPGSGIREEFLAMQLAAERHLSAHARFGACLSLCHSDAHHLNVIDNGGLALIDWEYAHVGDPFWDLAAWIGNHDLGADLQELLFAAYLGRTPTKSECDRLGSLIWLFDYVCLLWSEVYRERHLRAAESAGELARRSIQLAARLRTEN